MRQLHRRSAPDDQPGRQARGNGLFRRPHQWEGAFFKGVLLQVDGAHQAEPCAGRHRTLAQDEAGIHRRNQQAFPQVVRHGGVNTGDQLRGAVQVYLRQDQPKGGRRIPDGRVRLVPVFRFGSILVAGDTGPGFPGDGRSGQQDTGGTDADAFKGHGGFLLDGLRYFQETRISYHRSTGK